MGRELFPTKERNFEIPTTLMKTRLSGAAASHRNVAWMKKTSSMTESAIAQRARRAASRTGIKGYRDLQNTAKEFLDKRTQKASYAFECVMWAEMNKEKVSMETEAHGPATVSMAARTNGNNWTVELNK